MDVVWQDGVGSFLGSGGTDSGGSLASYLSADGGAVWLAPADSGLFSSQSMLWESAGDSRGDSYAAAFTQDATETEASTVPVGWIANGASEFASGSPTLDGGLLWNGAGDTSGSLSTIGGAGGLGSLAALDLGAGTASSLWQQFANDFAGRSAPWLADVPHLLWTGGSGQPPLAPPISGDSLHLTGSLVGPSVAPLAPEHLVWTDPSVATGLTAGPALAEVAATPVMSGAGAEVPSSSGLPINGSHR
jgi:hypothetical protein